ncbi:MAG: SpaA isopeptide-forming pilin-related protein, partial [Coriobacteriales bacterium]|nr:SpaA isopeptide-forming pilin-related protein [Coriobacteriales bacterium]
MQKFRNALADGNGGTGCTDGKYLAGVRMVGDYDNVYWSEMYKVSFNKKDNKGYEVADATFTLFEDAGCSIATTYVATSADGEWDTDAQGELLDKGVVNFVSVPIGAYYMKETVVPDSFRENDNVYLVLVGSPYLSPNQGDEKNQAIWGSDGPLGGVPNAATLVDLCTIKAGKYYGIFPLGADGKADVSKNLASATAGIENIRSDYEAYFLKVDSAGEALPNAEFTVYADEACTEVWSRTGEKDDELPPVKSADGTAAYKKKDNTNVPKGVVYFRELPVGTYYLKETAYPERNGNNRINFYVEEDRVFRLDVQKPAQGKATQFELSELKDDGTYSLCKVIKIGNEDYYYIRNKDAVCKLTDGADNLLYIRGRDGKTLLPAIYASLAEGFAAAEGTLYTKDGLTYSNTGAVMLKVLKDFTLTVGEDENPITYKGERPLTLTTAEKTVNKDKYIFATTRTGDTARAELKRGYSEVNASDSNAGALITMGENTSLTLQNINLNGQKDQFNGRALQVKPGASLTIGSSTILQNFRQTADAASTDDNDIKGGAILLEDGASLTIDGGNARSAIFRGNAVENNRTSGKTGADGGAIAIGPGCTVSIRNAQFTGNSATSAAENKGNGGAIGVTGTKGAEDVLELTLENAVFTGNTASYRGGAIRTGEKCKLTLTNDTFTGNEAGSAEKPGEGGAVAVLSDQENVSALKINGGTYTGNQATSNGGAIKIGGYGTLTITGNAALRDNTALNGGAVVVA